MKKRLIFGGSAALVFCSLLVFWRLLILAFDIPGYLLPTPLAVVRAATQRLPELWASLMISAEAAIGGLVASIAIGVLIALIFARSPWIRKIFFPYTILLQTVPILAVAPLIIIWVGPGLLAVGVVTFVICLAPIIANTTQGLVSVDESLVQLFLMHNASRGKFFPSCACRTRCPISSWESESPVALRSSARLLRVVCRFWPSRTRRPRVFHSLRSGATPNRLSLRPWSIAATLLGVYPLLYRDVFRVACATQMA